jgi:Family of unknown function (DUF6114)
MSDSAQHAESTRAGPAPAGHGARGGAVSVAALASAGWARFRSWRRARPFWAGLFLLVAGAEILIIPLPMHSMGLILHIGTGGVLGILIGAILIAAALLLWFHPVQHIFYSIVAVLLAVAALIATNLGGFLIGTILGVIGGSLGFAWTPLPPGTPARRRRWSRGPAGPADAGTEPASAANSGGGSGGAASSGPLASDHRTRPGPGTVIGGALPIVGIITGLLHLVPGLPAPSADPTASPTRSASCAAAPAPSLPVPLPIPTPSPSASCSPAATPSPVPSPTMPRSSSPHAAKRARASASPSPSATPRDGSPPPVTLATSPSSLTAASALITGFAYRGLVTVPTSSGKVSMMQFSMTSLSLSGVRLTIREGGAVLTTQASQLSLTGKVTLYATELSGSLLGVPVTITPASPVSVILQVSAELNVTQRVPVQMTNVTTLQPYTSASGMTASALQIS